MSNISIVLVDDHVVLRSGLRSLLEHESGYSVIGEAADGPTAIELVVRLHPDVLVLDLMLPGMSGLEVIRHVRQHAPGTRVVVLSMHANALYVREALQAGAVGYVLKEAEASELLQAVGEAAQNRRYLSQALMDQPTAAQVGVGVEDPYELLTDSERAILKLVARGHTSTEIAHQLCLSTRTIETYRASLMHKLELKNTAELVRYAIRRGIIALE
ncbi:MAG: response regulator transcription factor [Chloroflexaceae bacterium]|jgi:DNA-binding NarL/FixJ family response regulator|nr:response regulator transcription factor [Chloroflexaceae bacterium]